VLTNGVALPLPRQYLTGGFVDAGVDYAAPGGTPEYAMGDGVIVGEGISGFGPNAPILRITDGPLKGMEVYYGHAGPDLVHVGQRVHSGQQITIVGYGIVGISTGPHLEVGFYPPAAGSGGRMLSVINSMLREHPTGRAWGSGGQLISRTTRRGARLAYDRRTRRWYFQGYSGTGGGSGGTSVGAPAVTSSTPSLDKSSSPDATPVAPPSPDPASTPTAAAPPESAVTPAPAASSSPSGVDEAKTAPTVDSAQTAPAATSAPIPAPTASGPAPTAGSEGTDNGGSSAATPVGSPGTATTTEAGGAGSTASVPQPPVSQAPRELTDPQGSTLTKAGSAPSATGPASSATSAATASAATTAVTPASHDGGASGAGAAPSEPGAAHAKG
jgi:hypothetical protein